MTKSKPNPSPPEAIESEEAVLGCVLINADAYYEVAAFLKPEDFYLHKNRWIWEAFESLRKQNIPIDLRTICDELEKHNHLVEAGGAGYLTSLINCVPTSLHAEAYGRQVQRQSVARQTIELATSIAQVGYAEGPNPEEMFNRIHSLVAAMGAKLMANRSMRPINEIALAYYDYLVALTKDPAAFAGTPYGLIDLDRLLGGARAPDLITIAGRPGMGKTAFMLGVGLHASVNLKKRVAIFSLEMSSAQLTGRMLSNMTGINVELLHRGALVGDEWNRITEALSKLSAAPMIIDDSGVQTPSQIEAKCHKFANLQGLDLVIVDYMQLMSGPKPRYGNRVEEVSDISRGLKQAAKSLNVPILAGAQLSRGIEQRQDKRPVLSDLRESGSIEQDSDVVAFLHQPENESISRIIVGKNRHGAAGDVEVYFRKQTTSFHDAVLHNMP